MARFVRLAELLAGVEGTALFQHVLDGDDAFVARRVAGLRRQLAALDDPDALGVEVPEFDVDAGYQAWAGNYDIIDNALIRAEEPLVDRALAGLAPGIAVDAACGTGRQTARLAALGHTTIGVDRSAAMLAIAKEKVPDAEFRIGDMTALPFDNASVDVATCSLALTHLADPTPAVAELARVVRPGGRVVLSDAHPMFVVIQGQALFPVERGFAFVRNHVHLHSSYLAAFNDGGLEVRACYEAPMESDFTKGLYAGAAEAAAAVWSRIPVVLVWELERT